MPAGVAHAEQYRNPPGLQPLPEEAALIERALVKRRNEFITTRHCARQAMKQLGVPEAAVLKENRDVPLWPAGIVGSLNSLLPPRSAVHELCETIQRKRGQSMVVAADHLDIDHQRIDHCLLHRLHHSSVEIVHPSPREE